MPAFRQVIPILFGAALLFLSGCQSAIPAQTQTNTPTKAATRLVQTPTPRSATSTATPSLTPALGDTEKNILPILESLGKLGKGFLNPIVRTQDGKNILIPTGKELIVLNASDFSVRGSLQTSEAIDKIAAISPDGRFILLNFRYGLSVINLETIKEVIKLGTGEGSDPGAAFTPDSQSIIFRSTFRTSGGPYYSICRSNLNPDSFYKCYPILNEKKYHTVSHPAISPDGRLVAAGYQDSTDNILYLWDTMSAQIVYELKGQPAKITSVSFKPDGSILATAGSDGVIRFWSLKTGQLQRVINRFTDSISDIEFTPTGSRIKVKVVDQDEITYDLASNQITPSDVSPSRDPYELQMLQAGYILTGLQNRVAFSPDGARLALAAGSVQIWDVKTRLLTQALAAPAPFSITGLAFSPDGNHVGVSTRDSRLLVWDVRTGALELDLHANRLAENLIGYSIGEYEQRGFIFSDDSNQVAFTNGLDIEIWDIAAHTNINILERAAAVDLYPTSVSYSLDGRWIYGIFNHNVEAAVWDAASGKLLRRLNLPPVDHNAFSASALHQNFFTRNNFDETGSWVELWDLAQNKLTRLPTPNRYFAPIRFSADGRFLLAAYAGQIYLWRSDTGELIDIVQDENRSDDLALSPNGTIIATVSEGVLDLWDTASILQAAFTDDFVTPTPLPTPTGWNPNHNEPIKTPLPTLSIPLIPQPVLPARAITSQNASSLRQKAAFGNGVLAQLDWNAGTLVLTTSQGIFTYDAATLNETVRTFRAGIWINASRSLPDGRTLYSGYTQEEKIQLWDSTQENPLVEIDGSGNTAISPDGRWLVYPFIGGLAAHNMQTGKVQVLLNTDWYTLGQLTFSPNGKYIAAVRSDRSIRIWDLESGIILNGLGGSDAEITQLAFSPDSNFISAAAGGAAWIDPVIPGLPSNKIEYFQSQRSGNLALFDQTVTAVVLSPGNALAAIGTSEHDIWLHDRLSGRVMGKLSGHASDPIQMAFSPDGKRLVSLDRDGQLILWDVAQHRLLVRENTQIAQISGLTTLNSGELALWGKNTIWQLNGDNASLKHITALAGRQVMAVSPAGDLAAAYTPLRISLYDATSGLLLQTLPDEAEDPWVEYNWEGKMFRQFNSAAFGANGKRIATAGSGGVWIYDLPEGKLVQHLPGNYARNVFMSADGDWFLASPYAQISPPVVENVDSGASVSIGTNTNQGYFLDDGASYFSLANTMTKIGLVDNRWEAPSRLLIFDPASGNLMKKMDFEGLDLTSLAFNQDASLAAVGQENGSIYLVDLTAMKIVATLTAHHSKVTALAFSANGKVLYSVGAEGIVKFWTAP